MGIRDPTTQIGIEIEYWITDTTGILAPADDIVSACDWTDPEFVHPLLEVKTPPCQSPRDAIKTLVTTLTTVDDVARANNKRLVPLGTPLGDEPVPHTDSRRIAIQQSILGTDFTHATHCAGTHVHFEQVAVTDQLRLLTALDPAFALVNTTPYYRGRRIGTCARPLVYRRRCYQSLPTHGQLWNYPSSIDEWRDRIQERYTTFIDEAVAAGYDRDVVESKFEPETSIWSPVRLRDDLGTIEWRAPDAMPPKTLAQFLEDITRLIRRANKFGTRIGTTSTPDSDTVTIPPLHQLAELVNKAMTDGLSSKHLTDYLGSFGIDPTEYRPYGSRIEGHPTVDSDLVRRLRLRAADQFTHELISLQSTEPRRDRQPLFANHSE